MTASLRFYFIFACTLTTAALTACNGGGGGTDTESNQSTTSDDSTSDGTTTTTDGTTTATTADSTSDAPTTDAPTTDGTATTDPGTTTDDTTTDTGVGPALSWAGDVYRVAIEGNCGCHNLGSGMLTMNDAGDSYMNLVGVDASEAPGFKRVAAGDPGSSYLLAKLRGVAGDAPFMGNATQMPLGAAPLSDDTIDLVEEWIAHGALP